MNFEVFARVKPGDDLKHVGSVEAPNERIARTYALTTYDEETWNYMAIVRREDIVNVRAGEADPISRGEMV